MSISKRAKSVAVQCITLVAMEKGLDALFGFVLSNNLSMPGVVMKGFTVLLHGLRPLSGMLLSGSLANTGSCWSFNTYPLPIVFVMS